LFITKPRVADSCKENNIKKLDEDVEEKLNEDAISINSVKNNLSDKNILIPDLSDKLSEKLEEETKNNVFFNSKENGFKCILCNIIYKHSQSLYTHKKQKHPQKALLSRLSSEELLPNYDTEIENINNGQTEKTEIEKFKELFLSQIKKQDYYEKQINTLLEKNKELELFVKTSKSKTNITNNTNSHNTTNTNNGTINNINIVQFGKLNNNLSNNDLISVIYMTEIRSLFDKLLLRSPSIKSS
jgi:hypothetical protein